MNQDKLSKCSLFKIISMLLIVCLISITFIVAQPVKAFSPYMITLRSVANNKYVSVANISTPLIANKTSADPSTQFLLIDLGGGYVALQSNTTGKFVCAENAGNSPLIANRSAINGWEMFLLVTNADGTKTLHANANGKFVCAENAGSSSLIANRTAIGGWEKFILQSVGSTPTPTPTPIPTPTLTPTPTNDIMGKVYVGYQGWFNAIGDDSPILVNRWKHWSESQPSAGNVTFDLWPDISEYSQTFQTGLANLGNGQPAKLFSSYSTDTVNLHLRWMRDYGIDGCAVQRFGAGENPIYLEQNNNSIVVKVKNAAETYGRKFYVMYDVSRSTDINNIKNDWSNTINGILNITASPNYAKQDGKVVVAIWGLGVYDRPFNASESLELINWFKNQGCYVIGGVPNNWRTCTGDSKPGFENTYLAFDMISPWTVGRFSGIAGADSYKTELAQDYSYCNANGIDYQPVIFPGFSFNNSKPKKPRNEMPRLHGEFMWRQFYNIRDIGIGQAYIAMFDEYDEATAIAKAATDSSKIPTDQWFLTLDADGVSVSSDFYLRLSKNGIKMLKGTIGKTSDHTPSTPHLN